MTGKARVSSMDERGARVIVPTRDNYVTEPLFIPEYVGAVAVDDLVAFIEFDDLTGIIVCVIEEG